MDQAAEDRKRMLNAIESRDVGKLWDIMTAAIEQGFVKYPDLNLQQAAKMKGRSCVRIYNESAKDTRGVEGENDEGISGNADNEKALSKHLKWRRRAGQHQAQANRLTNITRRIKACTPTNGANREKELSNTDLNEKTTNVYLEQARK